MQIHPRRFRSVEVFRPGILVAVFTLLCASAAAQEPRNLIVSPLFGHNMVLQQGRPLPVWGTAAPARQVTVTLNGSTVSDIADTSGNWMVQLPAMDYGGPYDLTVAAGDTKVYKNVMIGEVWFAAGQSNMGITLSDDDSAALKYPDSLPDVREFAVPNEVSSTPRGFTSGGEWKICTPANAGSFSAVAYHFARLLHQEKKVAVGIVRSAWGGTRIEAWISGEQIQPEPEPAPAKRRNAPKVVTDWYELKKQSDLLAARREELIAAAGNGFKAGVHLPGYKERKWRKAEYPLNKDNMKSPDYAWIWLRKTFVLPAGANANELKINLGKVEMTDETYINGVKIGEGNDFHDERIYTIPGNVVRDGKNVIAIKLLSRWGGGHLGTRRSKPAVYNADSSVVVPLTGAWSYNFRLEPELPVVPEYQNKSTALFNAMVHPVIPYAIKGVLWYQGESNLKSAYSYRDLLTLLVADWRNWWEQGNIPFIAVQLPSFSQRQDVPSDGEWPVMRESQASVLRMRNTAIAVTVDTGDPEDIHPRNKDTVGKRLYVAANSLAYEDPVVYSGPLYSGMRTETDSVRLTFDHTGSGLIDKNGGSLLGFALAGADQQFHWADARIEGDTVILHSTQVRNPVAVRYAWANYPEADLFNREGLPAVPFRTDRWPVATQQTAIPK